MPSNEPTPFGTANEFISGTSVTYIILHLFVSRLVFRRFWCLDLVAPEEIFVWSWNECPKQPFADDGFLLLSVVNFNACCGFRINVNDFEVTDTGFEWDVFQV